jgi:type II secretory pathway pseudopilin PulG
LDVVGAPLCARFVVNRRGRVRRTRLAAACACAYVAPVRIGIVIQAISSCDKRSFAMSSSSLFVVARGRRAGMTLLELVVVLGVLTLLGALVIPKIAGLVERSRSSTQAYTTADIGRQLEIFSGMNATKYPDGWDTLLNTTGDGLYSGLNTNLTLSSNPILTTTGLSTEQVKSLSDAGISHAFLHATTTTAPSFSGVDRRHYGTAGSTGHDGTANISTVAVINEAGSRGLNILVNDFGLNPNKAATDTTLTRINSNVYVALGLGPKSTIVQTQLLEAPLLENKDSATKYSRAIVVFEVPNAPAEAGTILTPARIVGILGPDGRTKGMAQSDYKNVNGEQPH